MLANFFIYFVFCVLYKSTRAQWNYSTETNYDPPFQPPLRKASKVFTGFQAELEDFKHNFQPPLRKASKVFTGSEAELGDFKHNVFICKPTNLEAGIFKAICAGSIIRIDRVLSSAHCLYTNRKRERHTRHNLRVIAGTLTTVNTMPAEDTTDTQQWRKIAHIYSQKFFRFPHYNLVILLTNKPWHFNGYVNMINFASKDADYDGYCHGVAVKPTKAWQRIKYLHTEELHLVPRGVCEKLFIKNLWQFLCTKYDTDIALGSEDNEGGGLVCLETGDPKENNDSTGILVAIHSVMNTRLPTLHTKVSVFHDWITDAASLSIPWRYALYAVVFIIVLIF